MYLPFWLSLILNHQTPFIFNFLLFVCLAGMQEDFINSLEKVATVINIVDVSDTYHSYQFKIIILPEVACDSSAPARK